MRACLKFLSASSYVNTGLSFFLNMLTLETDVVFRCGIVLNILFFFSIHALGTELHPVVTWYFDIFCVEFKFYHMLLPFILS